MTIGRRLPLPLPLLVGVGGGLGGGLRALLADCLPAVAGSTTIEAPVLVAINLSGALLAGLLKGRLSRAGAAPGDVAASRRSARLDAFLIAGCCGGYTSYSAFVTSAVVEWQDAPARAGLLVAATVVLAPLAALAGMAFGRGYPACPSRDLR